MHLNAFSVGLVFACGIFFMYCYYYFYPPQCPSCKVNGTTNNVWSELRARDAQKQREINVVDEDI
jgi:hypothetical protein